MSKSHLNLSSLDGTNGFRINGIDSGDRSGRSVSSAGDVNGDGVDDVIIGAYLADPDGKYNAGESYIVYGSENWSFSDLELSSLDGTNGFRINGIDPQDYSGDSVSSAGDVNGDGIDDIIIGAPDADPDGKTNAGESYVVFGSSTRTSAELDLSSLDGTNGFQIIGINSGDNSGYSVSSAGDVNGDGIDDIIIGAYEADPDGKTYAGESYVVFGSSTRTSADLELSSLDGTNGFQINGIVAYDYSGYSVSSAGDVNGDGIDDIIIGAPTADPNGKTNAGESYVVFGSSTRTSAELEISSLDGTNGFRINGIDADELSGYSVSSAGDVNGDGIDDIIIGAPANPYARPGAGRSYVVFGSSTRTSADLELSSLDGTNGFQINGIVAYDYSGDSVSSAGDVNGDGIDDIIIGAPSADTYGQPSADGSPVVFMYSAGQSYVVFGSSTRTSAELDLSSLDGTNGFQINGIDKNIGSGGSVSSAGDVNGDGVDDIIIGAMGADPNGNEGAGESYVVFGERLNNTPTVTSSAVTSIDEDASYSYTFTASDVDAGDMLTLSAQTKPDWLKFDAGTGVLSGTPTNDEVGDHSVVLKATDGSGAYSEQSFTVSVSNVNDAPVVTSSAVTSINEDASYSYTFTASDVDVGDTVTLSAETKPDWLSFDAGTGVLSGTPTNDEVGDHSVVLKATDGSGAYSEQSFTVSVSNVNDAPVVTSSAVTSVKEDASYSYTVTASDVDAGDTKTFTSADLPNWLSLNAKTGALTGRPSQSDVGEYSIKLTVSDKSGASDTQSFNIKVENVNDTPLGNVFIRSTPKAEGVSLEAVSRFKDADGLPDEGSYTYQWYRGSESISGASSKTYSLATEDSGKEIKVEVGYQDSFKTQEFVTSASQKFQEPKVKVVSSGVTENSTTFVDENDVSNEIKVVNNTSTNSATTRLVQNTGSGSSGMTASLPQNISVITSGPTTSVNSTVAASALITSVQSRKNTTTEETSEDDISAGIERFTSSLPNAALLDVRTVEFSSTDQNNGMPMSISGSSSNVSTLEAIVVDTSSFGAGVIIELDNIEFAAIIGPAILRGGAGSNIVHADEGQQTIILGEDDDELNAGGGDDVVGSKGGNDTISGGSGNDITFGGTGNDSVNGGTGDDKVTDSWGTDELNGDDGNDVIRSFEGGDIINGGAGADTIYGSRGDDVISGGDDNDVIYGDTFVFASRGADELSGGNGDDILQGGFGADTFIFNSGETGDNRIERIATQAADFEVWIDKIKFVGFGDDLTAANILAQWQDTTEGAKLTAGDMSIQLTGINASDLSLNDFEFVY